MARYALQLINPASNLDLTKKKSDIHSVFSLIRDGGGSGRSFKDLDKYEIVQIQRDHIVIDVSESGDAWHPHVGKFLANDHDMREYCDPKNRERMFKWRRIAP
jgi:hypothetical protein